MEQVLVHQFVGSQLCNQVLLVQQSAFIKCKRSIYFVVGHGAVNDIVIVGKISFGAVSHHKVEPFLSRGFEEQAVQVIQQFCVQSIFVHVSFVRLCLPHTAADPFFRLLE